MELQGYFTDRGLELAAKLSAGATLEITRVLAGAGQTALSASGLAKIKQEPTAGTPRQSGATAVIPVTLAAAQASAEYSLTELGVYARDPDKGEILYKIYRLAEPVKISPASRLTLRFYLEETVSRDVSAVVSCSPAGLITETDFAPVRSRVEQTGISSRTVHLEAAELQAFLDSLPRLLTERLTVKVSGEVTGGLTIRDFYGPGYIFFPNENLQIHGELLVASCSVMVHIKHVSVTATEDMGLNSDLISVSDSRHVYLQDVTMSGYGDMRNTVGVVARNCSAVKVADCRFTGLRGAAMATGSSLCTINNSTGENNAIGASVYVGGIVFLHGTTPATVGGAANAKQSGLIVDKNGNLI